MDEFLNQVADGIASRFSGPMHFRFILQPLIAIIVGIRDGRHDAKAGTPPFIYDLVFNKADRKASLKGAWKSVRIPILLGTVLDATAQYLIFHRIRVLPAALVGICVIAIPYALARGITNRIVSSRAKPAGPAAE